MRVLYVSDAQSVHTRRWAEYFHHSGADVHVASFRPADIPGVTTHVLPTFGLGKLGYFFSILFLHLLFRKLRPDVVHAQYITSYGFLSAVAGLHPLVITAWGTDVLISPKQSRLIRFLARFAVQNADAVTTVAEHMNTSVAELGISVNSVSAVPFGVDTQRFLPPITPRSEVGPLKLICTRNFDLIYDVSTLITALQKARERGVHLLVDLVGAGPLRPTLESQVVRAGLSSSVTFHGHVDHSRLTQLLAQADIFVSPALSDGNNVSLNEAMACTAFPIATDIPANAQWIEDGINGLLYQPGNSDNLTECILRAAGDTAWRLRAGELNRAIVEQRADWRVCADRMTEIYSRVIAQAGAK